MREQKDITNLLADVAAGKEGAEAALMPLVYSELLALAKGHMRHERSDHTLQATALVHEAYLRLGGMKEASWEDRAHYFRIASQAMRRVLIDYARRKRANKHGGGWNRNSLDEEAVFVGEPSVDLLALDSALTKLFEIDPRMAGLVELRFFGGLTVDDTARMLSISPRTARNDWRIARAWLKTKMG